MLFRSNTDPNVDVAIGNTPGSASADFPFDGQIEQVIIWNKALSPGEITTLYNSGAGLFDVEQQFPSSNFLTQSIITEYNATALGINGNNSKAVSIWAYPFLVPNPSEGGLFHCGNLSDSSTFGLRQFSGIQQWRLQLFGILYDVDFNAGASNTWTHFVVSHNGTTCTVWADGVQVASRTATLNTGDSDTFRIGLYDTQYFMGRVADVRVYNRALTQAEAQTIYNSRGHDTIFDSLQARWLANRRAVPQYGGTRTPALLGSWQTGTTHTATAGNNRLLVVCIAAEDTAPASTISSVTYGGQTMTELGYTTIDSGRVQTAAMYYLNEAGIAAAASSTITVTWS